jgi:hypothetical protein
VTAENGKLDEIPPRCFQKLPLPAEPVDSVFAMLVTLIAKPNHEHFVLRYALSVDMDNMMVMLCWPTADTIRVGQRKPIPIKALTRVHSRS